jgi:O-antigen biosynthesis protein
VPLIRRLGQALLHSPLHPLYLWLTGKPDPVADYRRYVAEHPARMPTREHWANQPLVSVLLPVHNPRREWLAAAIDSVRQQTYPHWELCICDDASRETFVDEGADEGLDQRIRYVRSAQPLGISGALNRAAQLASGAYLTFLDHDDLLSPVALHSIVEALQNSPAEFLYSDEDYVDQSGRPVLPHLKPDWSPELLSNCMYVGHLMVVSRERFHALGGFRSAFDGAQDYDLALRLAEAAAPAVHIPQILYHWRQHAGSVAQSTSTKPFTHTAGLHALEDAVRRRRWNATVVEDAIPNQYVLQWQTEAQAVDDVLVFSDPALRPLTKDWLARITAQLARPGIGIVGAKILRPDGTIHHAGIAVSKDHLAFAPGQGTHGLPYWKWLNFTREVTAVGGGFLAIRRSVFDQLGGFDLKFCRLREVDLCLRARQIGLQVLFLHDVVFESTAADEPGPDAAECELFAAHWNALLPDVDAYYRPLVAGLIGSI